MEEMSEEGATYEPQRFTKRPVTIEAIQWDGTVEGATRIIDWVLANGGTARFTGERTREHGGDGSTVLAIETIEGTMHAEPGWWVIRGVEGEFYPCKPSVFVSTYDPADDDTPRKGGRRMRMTRSSAGKGWVITIDGHDITDMVIDWTIHPARAPCTPAHVDLELAVAHVEIDQAAHAESRWPE